VLLLSLVHLVPAHSSSANWAHANEYLNTDPRWASGERRNYHRGASRPQQAALLTWKGRQATAGTSTWPWLPSTRPRCCVAHCSLDLCAVLCCAVLCCAGLGCIVMCCDVLGCAAHGCMLVHHVTLCRAVLCHALCCSRLYHAGLLCYATFWLPHAGDAVSLFCNKKSAAVSNKD
jgi:hypothetical protein